jgi:fructose-1,6-bisphosphatase/inositol monophosphatase family enzyme
VVLTELAGTVPWEGMTGLVEALGRQGCATRILGSSALCLASVGAGRASAAVLGRANPIDVAAGALIAAESGAVVRVAAHVDRALDFGRDGLSQDELGPGPALVACAPGVYAQFLRTLRAPQEAAG